MFSIFLHEFLTQQHGVNELSMQASGVAHEIRKEQVGSVRRHGTATH